MNVRIILACCALALSACGGGGDGPPDPKTVTISGVHPDALHLDAYAYNVPAFDLVYATIDGIAPEKLSFGVVVSGNAVQYVYDPTSGGGQDVSVLVDGTPANYLCPGQYSSEITFHVCTEPTCSKGEVNGSPVVIPVTYDVTGFWPDLPRPYPSFAIGSLHFGVGQSPAESDKRRTFRVGANPTAAWTVTSSVPWLSVDPSDASGGPVTVTASLVDAEVANLADNATYTGSITFDAGSSGTFTVPVDLTVKRTLAASEQIQNGTFAAGLAGWKSYTDGLEVADVSVTGGVLKVTPIAISTANEGSVLVVPDRTFQVTAGHHYRLTFDAWADAPRKLSADVQAGNTGMGRDFQVTTELRHYDVDAVFSASSSTASVDFDLGGSPTPVYLDNVSFREVP
jgi:hypothetical protein